MKTEINEQKLVETAIKNTLLSLSHNHRVKLILTEILMVICNDIEKETYHGDNVDSFYISEIEGLALRLLSKINSDEINFMDGEFKTISEEMEENTFSCIFHSYRAHLTELRQESLTVLKLHGLVAMLNNHFDN